MDDYKKESWMSLFQSALTEIEHAKMSGRIEGARTAIVARIEKLRDIPGLHADERHRSVRKGKKNATRWKKNALL